MRRARREVRKIVVSDGDSEGEESAGEEDEEEEEDVLYKVESDEEVEGVEEEGQEVLDEEVEEENAEEKEEDEATTKPKRERKPIKIKLKPGEKFCKVCKKTDHQAGFSGSIYYDCPNKPCYLCKKPGHTTMTCPHRIATEYGVTAAHRRSLGLLDFVVEQQLKGHLPVVKMTPVIPNKVDVAIIKLHSRRVTYIEFHPTKDNIVISGDKKGQLGIWDFESMVDKTVYTNVHSLLVNSIKLPPFYDGVMYTASSDGTVCRTDLETGVPSKLLDMNPHGWEGPESWKMMYAMDLNLQRGLVLTGDNKGFLHRIDMQTGKVVGKPLLLHKKDSKIVGLHCNPLDPDVFLSCGSDHMARIWDLRLLDSCTSLADLPHPRVVNSAYFSPISGNKILTTCQDNRLRVWDCLFSNLEMPSREIVHSHDFNRYLTAFRAEWDPKDASESLAVIGRYISDDFDGLALHPVDFIDITTGQLVAEVMDRNITTIATVNKLHPRLDIMVSGSSGSLFLWRPKEVDSEGNKGDKGKNQPRFIKVGGEDGKQSRGKGKAKSKTDYDSDDFSNTKSKIVETKVFTRKRKGS